MNPAIGAPEKQPPVHAVMIILIATGTLAEPCKAPTAVDVLLKDDPLAIPVMNAHATRGASLSVTGQIESMVKSLTSMATKTVCRGPM